MEERNQWIDIITKMYTDLHTSDRVMHVSKESDKKRDRIIKYLNRLEEVHKKVIQNKSESAFNYLESLYYDLYVINPKDIPESYFENEKRIMRERGYGNVELTEERKKLLINQIIEDQKKSLEPWIDYFLLDDEGKSYEMWVKYWVFQGLQKLGKYNKEKQKFSKRDKTTVYPFPPFERDVIVMTIHLMKEYIKNKTSEEEIKSALGEGNFKTLYEYSIKQISQKCNKQNLKTTEGNWVKYDQGSDYNILIDSLRGYRTGWCTEVGAELAKDQLANGDFYVYYTLDENNEPKVPRIAIRIKGHSTIREIRGIASGQNMEPEMIPILNEKLKEFPDRDKYYKKEKDMQRLTEIDKKMKNGVELDKADLKFLYEIDYRIDGFGEIKDPRIEEIKKQRNIKKDFAVIYNCKEEEIGTNINDLYDPNTKIYVGTLRLRSLPDEELTLPKIVHGYLNFDILTSAERVTFPEIMNGSLSLNGLTSAEGLVLPIDFDLNNLMCKHEVRNEIMANPSKYFRTKEDDHTCNKTDENVEHLHLDNVGTEGKTAELEVVLTQPIDKHVYYSNWISNNKDQLINYNGKNISLQDFFICLVASHFSQTNPENYKEFYMQFKNVFPTLLDDMKNYGNSEMQQYLNDEDIEFITENIDLVANIVDKNNALDKNKDETVVLK